MSDQTVNGSMIIQNTHQRYGALAIFFHWLTASLVLLSYLSIYYREYLADSDNENRISIQLHMSIGISIGVIVFLRLAWRICNKVPHAQSSSAWHLRAIKIGHFFLYLILFIMPISGFMSLINYLSNGGGYIDFFFLCHVDAQGLIEQVAMNRSFWEDVEDIAKALHLRIGNYIFSVLIFAHAGAALFHHFVLCDNTLSKITFKRADT